MMPGRFTYRPVLSCPPCLSRGAGRGHLLMAFPSAGICSGPGSEPLTSGSVTAVTRSLTQQRSPCYLGHGFTKFALPLKRQRMYITLLMKFSSLLRSLN